MNFATASYAQAVQRAQMAAEAAEEALLGKPPLDPEILTHAAALSLLSTAWATIAIATKP